MSEEPKVTRKLSAILSADVKGYSLLMAEDEAYTIKTLKAYRQIMSDLIGQHNGRVVDSPGDNVLAEFASAVNAVQCAVEIQKQLKIENDRSAETKRLQFRIGVNIGDVVQDGDRIYGSGVNVAARIEGLADPGGVCISRNAYDQIKDKLTLGYKYLGQHEVKNIKDPVRVYKLLMGPEDAGKLIGDVSKPATKNWIWATIVVTAVVISVIATLVYQNLSKPKFEPASVDNMAYPLPDKPSVAVLPFDNMSSDPEQEFFCDGLAEEIITALSSVPELYVIARNSTFAYKGKSVKVQQISEELGVQYILEGSVRKSGEKIRITAQLIDALKGHHLWAETYDRYFEDLFDVQEKISVKIITELRVQLTNKEETRFAAPCSENLKAYRKYLTALHHFDRLNRQDIVVAQRLAEEAIALDPGYACAYSLLGGIQRMAVELGLSKSPAQSLVTAKELVEKAIDINPSLAGPYAVLSHVYRSMEQYDKSIEEAEKAITLNPNSVLGNGAMGAILLYVGRSDEAILFFEKAIRLDPFSTIYFSGLGFSYFLSGRYEKAIKVCKKAADSKPDDFNSHICLASSYSLAGHEEEAKVAASNILKMNPNFSLNGLSKLVERRYKKQADKELITSSLRKAGIPETSMSFIPEKPSIAVLPFDNLSDDPEQEYFSDGIAVEIINGLVRWPSIVIIPRSSSFIYKGKTVDLKQVGREMGVRYVLEGSVRREGNRVRVNVQLVDVTTLKHLFSERYDREMKDIFAIQDEITMSVLTAMRVSLSGTGVPSKRDKPTKSIEAYLKLLQAEDIYISMNRDAQARARRLAEEAIALDPEYSRAHALLAATIGNEVLLGVYEDPQEALERAMAIVEKAVQLDDLQEMAHRVRGFLSLQNKDYEKAIVGGRRAVELAPNSVLAQVILGYFLYSAGRTEEAIPILEKAVALNPIPSPRALSHLGIAYRKARRYEEAVEVCRKLIQIEPNYIYPHLTLAATFAEMDKMEEARTEIKEVLRINPKYNVKLVPRSFPWKDQAELDRLADSLRKAGLK